jgi:hypothetical protein
MDLDHLRPELEQFIVSSAESRPGIAALSVLLMMAATVWIATVVFQRLIAFAVAVARVLLSAVAGLSAVVMACLVLVVFVLTG